MLQVDQLTCLVSPPVAMAAVTREAVRLVMGGTGSEREPPTVHVVSLQSSTESIRPDAVKAQVESVDPAISVTTHAVAVPDEPDAARRAIQEMVGQIGAGLVVVGVPVSGADPAHSEDCLLGLVDGLQGPLLVVREARSLDALKTILVPTDFSGESLHALRHATELADEYGASVVLLHVVDTTPYVALTPIDRLAMGRTTLTEHRARRRLQQFLDDGGTADVPIQTRVMFGDPTDRVAHVVVEQDVDVLVLGADDRPESFLSPVAERILHGVACPTLLVRGGDTSLLPGRSRQNFTPESDL